MIVLDVTGGLETRPRGWSRYVLDLAAALGDTVTTIGARRGPQVRWEQGALPLALRRRGATLVHSPHHFLPLRRPCPGVVTIHDLAFEAFPDDFHPLTRRKFTFFTPRSAASAERVVVPSPFTGRDVIERYGIRPSKVRIVPLAPSLPLGDAAPPPGEYVLAVGDVRAKKNLGVLAEAARRLGVRAVVAGVDAGAGEGLDGVELTGWLDDARLDALLRGAAALVHPSLYEGFGLVLVEAMARGVPVACADATALPETAAGAAELFDPHDPEACATAIERAVARRDELARLGRARAAELSWERTAALTRAVYEELV
jgi:glycosyltransferase involved in cell wall biosynthesis